MITGYNKKYLNLEETRIVRLLGKFKVMETSVVIKLWLEGYNNLTIFLGKFFNILFSLVVIFHTIFMTFVHYFVDQMVRITTEEK